MPRFRTIAFLIPALLAGFLLALPGTTWPQAETPGAPGDPARAEVAPVPVPEPTPLAVQYHRTGEWLWLLNQIWAIAIPGLIAFSGLSSRIERLTRSLARGNRAGTIFLFIAAYLALVFVLSLPLAYYQGFVRAHAYGLSNQTLGRWSYNRVVGLGVDMIGSGIVGLIAYSLLTNSPRRWWLYLGLASAPMLALVMLIVPVWIDPLFNHYGPMKNAELERSILDLAGRAGIEGSRVFEVDKSIDTKTVNANVTGLLSTKRIVLWDTLIARLEPREILVVMGHEMGHYMMGHVIRTVALAPLVAIPGLFLVNWWGLKLLGRYRSRLGFERLSDPASAPLLLMLFEVASLILSPPALAYSRAQEHDADRYALELTRDNHAAAMAFVKLQTENLGVPRHGLITQVFRASHPSLGDRIDFCNSYHPWRGDSAPRAFRARGQEAGVSATMEHIAPGT